MHRQDLKTTIISNARQMLLADRRGHKKLVHSYEELYTNYDEYYYQAGHPMSLDEVSTQLNTHRENLLKYTMMTTHEYLWTFFLSDVQKAWSHPQMSWDRLKDLAKRIVLLITWFAPSYKLDHEIGPGINMHGGNVHIFLAEFLYINWDQYYVPRDVADIWEQLDRILMLEPASWSSQSIMRFTKFMFHPTLLHDYQSKLQKEYPVKDTMSRLAWEQNADTEATEQWEYEFGKDVMEVPW